MQDDKILNFEDYLEYEDVTREKLISEYGGNKKASVSIVIFKYSNDGQIPIREVIIPEAIFDIDILSGIAKFKIKSEAKNMKQVMEAETILSLFDRMQKEEEVTCSIVVMHEDLKNNEFLGANDILTWYMSGDGFKKECNTLCFVIAETDLFNVADENYDYKEIEAEVIRQQEEKNRMEELEAQQELDKQARDEFKENLNMEQYDDSWATKSFVPDIHAEGEIETTDDGRNIFHRK